MEVLPQAEVEVSEQPSAARLTGDLLYRMEARCFPRYMIVARDHVAVAVDTAAAVVVRWVVGLLANNWDFLVDSDIEHLDSKVVAYMYVVAAVLADSLVVAYVVEEAPAVVTAAPYRTEKNDLSVT